MMGEDEKKHQKAPQDVAAVVKGVVAWAKENSELVWDRQADGRFRAGYVLRLSPSQSVMLKIEKSPGRPVDWHFGPAKGLADQVEGKSRGKTLR